MTVYKRKKVNGYVVEKLDGSIWKGEAISGSGKKMPIFMHKKHFSHDLFEEEDD